MDHENDVALLQIAVLQAWWESDVEETRKRKKTKKTQNISDSSLAGKKEEKTV